MAITAEAVTNVLKNTFSDDDKLRSAAETQLKKLELQPGYLTTLLQIICLTKLPVDLRQAASLRLKNIVITRWTPERKNPVSAQDKKIVKDNIVESVIVQSSSLIRAQVLESLYKIVRYDFPASWPELYPTIMKNITTNDKARVYGATCCLRMVFKKYQFRGGDVRDEVHELVQKSFPTLLALFSSLVKSNTVESFEMMRIVIKIFFLSTQLSLPPFLRDPKNITPWLQLLSGVFSVNLPQEQIPAFADRLKDHPLMKSKKWIVQIFDRLLGRFGHPSVCESDELPFAEWFYANWAEKFMASSLTLLQSKFKEKGSCTPRMLLLTLNYLKQCVDYSKTYKSLKPHLQFVLFEAVMPTLCLTPEDLSMWQRDPVEFVRRQVDFKQEFLDPRVAAQNLLIALVRTRTRDSLKMVLQFVLHIFTTYASSAPEKRNPIVKEAAMRMFGSLRKLLLSKKELHGQIENILSSHILGEFKSVNGFMRARANNVVGMYSRVKFEKAENRRAIVMLVTESLGDKELPVRMEASVAIARLLNNDTVIDVLRPHVPLILKQFFGLIDQIGNDTVVATLSALITQLGDDIAPYAKQIVAKMAQMFVSVSKMVKQNEEDDDSAFTAVECLQAINVILYSIETVPDLYPELEPSLQPLLTALVCEDGAEFFEDAMEMVTCLTYYSKNISDLMWSFCPKLLTCYNDWALDFVGEIVPPLDNFVSRGTERFFATKNPNLLNGYLAIIKKMFEEKDESREVDAQHGAKLLESIISNGRAGGKIDSYMPDILKLIVGKIQNGKQEPLKLLTLDLLAEVVHYNPVLFCQILAKAGDQFTETLFNIWLSIADSTLKGKYRHQKMAAIGLASLARMPLDKQPLVLKKAFPKILGALSHLLAQIIQDEKEEEEDEESDDDDQEGPEEMQDVDEDKDAETGLVGGSIAKHVKQVQKEQDKLNEAYAQSNGEIPYETIYDDMDEFVFFRDALADLAKNEAGFYQQWSKSLDAKAKDQIQGFLNKSKERVTEMELAKKAKAEKDKARTEAFNKRQAQARQVAAQAQGGR